MSEQPTLLQALITHQGTQSDRAFAARLGISHQQWSDTKRGRMPIGMYVLEAALTLWPDLGPLATAYLTERGRNRLKAHRQRSVAA